MSLKLSTLNSDYILANTGNTSFVINKETKEYWVFRIKEDLPTGVLEELDDDLYETIKYGEHEPVLEEYISPELLKKLEQEARSIYSKFHETTIKILKSNKDNLELLARLISPFCIDFRIALQIITKIMGKDYKPEMIGNIRLDYNEYKNSNSDGLIYKIIEKLHDGEEINTFAMKEEFKKDIIRVNNKIASEIFIEQYGTYLTSLKGLEDLYDMELVDYKGNRKNLVISMIQNASVNLGIHCFIDNLNGPSGKGKSEYSLVLKELTNMHSIGEVSEGVTRNRESDYYNNRVFYSYDLTVGNGVNKDSTKMQDELIAILSTDHEKDNSKMDNTNTYVKENHIKVCGVGLYRIGVDTTPEWDDRGQKERRYSYTNLENLDGDFSKERLNMLKGVNSFKFTNYHHAWFCHNFVEKPLIKTYNYRTKRQYHEDIARRLGKKLADNETMEYVSRMTDFENMMGILLTCSILFNRKLDIEEVKTIENYFKNNKTSEIEDLLFRFIQAKIAYRVNAVEIPEDNGVAETCSPEDLNQEPLETKQMLILKAGQRSNNCVFFTKSALFSYKINQGVHAKEYEVLKTNESDISKMLERLVMKGRLGKVEINLNGKMKKHYFRLIE